MRKLLNTLYITTPGSYLSKDGENVVVKIENEEKFRIPAHNIEGIVCFGYMGASPSLMAMCSEKNIGLSFLSEHGYFLGRVSGPVSGNVLLRRKQYRMADNEKFCNEISKIFIAGKISNSRTVLQRALRDHPGEVKPVAFEEGVSLLGNKIKRVMNCKSNSILRGIEGEAANIYFGLFDQMIVAQKTDFQFNGRNRRPPRDNVNAMLSFVYVLLMHEVRSALESVGLDPCVGFLHTDRPGRQSLALDMMEEFRPYIADRLVLSLINRKQINGKGFSSFDEGGIVMNDTTRKELLVAWQKRKQEEVNHPYLETSVPVGLLPYTQALLLARYLRGDIDNYPVFLSK